MDEGGVPIAQLEIMGDASLQQVDRVLLDVDRVDRGGRAVADDQEGDRAAARAQLRDAVAVLHGGKMREQDGVGGEVVRLGDEDLHPVPERLGLHSDPSFRFPYCSTTTDKSKRKFRDFFSEELGVRS